MDPIALNALETGGLNAPEVAVQDFLDFKPSPKEGALRYRAPLGGGTENLDALVINRKSDILIVGLHGAVNRQTTRIPRFERLRSVMSMEGVSGMFFGDPSLYKSEDLQLSWYTGWDGFDGHQAVADWTVAAAKAIGATRIIFTGSSGGGFAALQISSLVPGSMAVAFNAQTDVAEYRVNGEGYGAQRTYAEVVWPSIAETFASTADIENPAWAKPIGERSSAVSRYSSPQKNYVFIIQNTDEFHHEDHYLPFLAAASTGSNRDRLRTKLYQGGVVHNPPAQAIFEEVLAEAIAWAESLPSTTPGATALIEEDGMRITIEDFSKSHTGSIDEAFKALLESWTGDSPAFTQEAKELRDLWLRGEGRSDEAMTICASLGIFVSQQ